MRVMVIDDHALIREGMAQLLRRIDPGIDVLEAGSCEEAIALAAHQPDLSLVLLDLHLPGMSGTDGLVELRSRHPGLPVVVVSGERDPRAVLEAIRRGAMGFIPKTHSASLMQGALELVLRHGGIYLPPDVFADGVSEGQAGLSAAGTSARASTSMTRPSDLGLTVRQAEVLHLLLQGKSNKLICRELDLSEGTVKTHVTAVLRSLNVTTRTEAVVAAHRLNLVFGS